MFLTALGYGRGNLKDSTLEKLAQHGNGHYAYIDNEREARKIFVEEAGSLIPLAKDVKIQVEFDPERVRSYRLIGYENRLLTEEEFKDDKKDAGDIGTGHAVTALYELAVNGNADANWLTVNLRYKEPAEDTSKEINYPVAGPAVAFDQASADTRFASSVAAFGMILRDSRHKGNATYTDVRTWAKSSSGEDKAGYRKEFLQLIEVAEGMGK